MQRLAILGGGISGLTLAWRVLKRSDLQNARLVIYESANRLGGWVRSKTVEVPHSMGKVVLEYGPRTLRAADYEATAMIGEIPHLNPLPAQGASKRYLIYDSRLQEVPSTLSGVLYANGREDSPFHGIVRTVLLEPFVSKAPGPPDESVSEYCERRFGSLRGKRFYDRVFSAVVNGIYACDGRHLEMRSAFPDIDRSKSVLRLLLSGKEKRGTREETEKRNAYGLGGSSVFGFQMGNEEIVRGLEKILLKEAKRGRVEIRKNTRVTGLSFSDKKACVKSTAVANDGAGGARYMEEEEYDHVVSAMPAEALYQVLPRSKPNVHTPYLAPMLSRMRSSTVQVVHVVLSDRKESDRQRVPAGFGALQPFDAGWNQDPYLLGIIFDSNLFPSASGKWVRKFTLMFKEAGQGDSVNRAIKRLYQHIYSPRNTSSGAQQYKFPKVLHAESETLKDCIPMYLKGHEERLHHIHHELRDKRLSVLGSWTRGVGVPKLMRRAAELADRLDRPGATGLHT